MKYFRPELLARCRSSEDSVADAAAKEWDEAVAAYRARFKSIRGKLPPGARRLCTKASLHDARLLGAAWSERQAIFTILLQVVGAKGRGGEVLEMNYHPVAGPNGGVTLGPRTLSEKDAPRLVHVLYDEFDLDEEHSFFTHSLLLTNGREIGIRFHNLTCRWLEHAVSPTDMTEVEVKWPLAETAV